MKSDDADPLLEAWKETLRTHRQDTAILEPQGKSGRSFAEIEEEARAFESSLLRQFQEGEVIAIQIGNDPSWPALLLACLRKRLVALPLERSMAARERDVALQICHAAAVVGAAVSGGTAADMPPETAASTPAITIRPLSHERIDWGTHPPILLKLTSGTTAAPRAIRFRSEQLLADCIQICDTMGIGADDLNFGVIPLSHSYGFSNLVTPLLVRGVPLVVSRDRLPRAVLDDLARTDATVFPGMPVFYQAFCEMENAPVLAKLRLCISAGAPLPLKVARKFREKFQRSIHSFYGSSECGGICYDREARLLEPGFVGQPMSGVEVNLLEADASASLIRVRTAGAGDGYFPEPDEEKLGNGCFTPDDLLTTGEHGFRIVGRISDVINVAGKKVNPAEVEAELLRYEGVRAAVVFGRDSTLRNEEVSACVVASEGVHEGALLDFCRGRLSGWQVPKRIFFVEEIPVNERGKVSRRALAQHFSAAD
jgi:acyl-CoA synthetase (AMP-forming)/AMP-acid ligase II